MTLSVLLTIALALGAPQAPEPRAEAERLARSGDHRAALVRFETLAAADPGDVESRLWIGRLHLWMGHPHLARVSFETILSTVPGNIEALVGAATAAMRDGAIREAAFLLTRAEGMAPGSAEVLAAQGRYHRLTGRLRLAQGYFDRAVLLSPADPDIREGRDNVRAQRAHRIEANYQFERFSLNIPDTHAGSVELNLRAGDPVRLFGRVQRQRKFGLAESRGGGGLEWQASPRVQLRASGVFAVDTAIYPRSDAAVDADLAGARVIWTGSLRHLRFLDSRVWIGSGGAAWSLNERTALTFRYYRSQTDFSDVVANAGNNAFAMQAVRRAARRVWISAGYARGNESFETVTADRLRQRGADTLTAGTTWRFTATSSIQAGIERQRRDDRSRLTTATLTVVRRF